MTDYHVFDPRQGHGLAHDPLNSIVVPRPIGWISTRSAEGALNLAPYSFFNLLSYKPAIVGFASTGVKDSLRNVRETGEFAWSLVTRPLAEAMNRTSAMVPPEVDEFELAGLTPAPSDEIAVPRVGESPVSFECKVTKILRLDGHAGNEGSSWLVLGEAVRIHIDRRVIRDGVYQTVLAEPVARGGGPTDYFWIGEENRFHMRRPD
ncbi:NADH-FMN oxidoreductase RutF, flavin reductase (DIM6/NTAB) family [Tistlia consotensis]|uniref:NADH-FMN oxidoreductase RutF, flavin reductase (DIM6/NTAB) family n=1 Tax=Tistlia consotensis USBA 355 TaxID=560819 RepID=A0A1Y6BGW4_9PROT|nr:flavin reductase family protein [Tistlia consotensis]SMF07072.1 NADH-FMN oxidoreductase RutF, flavin reductase (DIM6/NTAB) family [Tistlia consotensis USBA 355]SNR36109.1 NADH-FMN oxidoreductase RutF, flavin reductase (DIM6/NTAB) family [Tistlia consotensis]